MNYKKRQEKIFEEHKKLYNNFKVAFHISPKHPWRYKIYRDKEYLESTQFKEIFPNHRQVFPDEVVIDLDTEDMNDYEIATHKVAGRLQEYKITYSLWDTGGKTGYHFHTTFPELKKYDHLDRVYLKKEILKWLTRYVPETVKVDAQLCGNHLVRAEYGYYEKTPTKEKYKLPIESKDYGKNLIPQFMLDKLKKQKEERKIIKKELKNFKGEFPCIKYFESEDFVGKKDGRKRALFIIASYYKNKLSDLELFEKLKKYNQYLLNNRVNKQQIISTIKSNKGLVGCPYRKELLQELRRINICEECQNEKNNKLKSRTKSGE